MLHASQALDYKNSWSGKAIKPLIAGVWWLLKQQRRSFLETREIERDWIEDAFPLEVVFQPPLMRGVWIAIGFGISYSVPPVYCRIILTWKNHGMPTPVFISVNRIKKIKTSMDS